jgi:hypothetical protein
MELSPDQINALFTGAGGFVGAVAAAAGMWFKFRPKRSHDSSEEPEVPQNQHATQPLTCPTCPELREKTAIIPEIKDDIKELRTDIRNLVSKFEAYFDDIFTEIRKDQSRLTALEVRAQQSAPDLHYHREQGHGSSPF